MTVKRSLANGEPKGGVSEHADQCVSLGAGVDDPIFTHEEFKALGGINDRIRLFILVRARFLDVDSSILRIELILA
jgi:hypothetical protein